MRYKYFYSLLNSNFKCLALKCDVPSFTGETNIMYSARDYEQRLQYFSNVGGQLTKKCLVNRVFLNYKIL